MILRGLILIAFGILYVVRPNTFRSGIFMKYSNSISKRTPEEYAKYMRRLGIIFIIIGSLIFTYDYLHIYATNQTDNDPHSGLINFEGSEFTQANIHMLSVSENKKST